MKKSAIRKISGYKLPDFETSSSSSVDTSKMIKIGEASRLLGISIDTLRRWERKGWLKTYKTPGGTRLCDRTQLQKLNPSLKKGPKEVISPLVRVQAQNQPVIEQIEAVQTFKSIPEPVQTVSINLQSDQPSLSEVKNVVPEVIEETRYAKEETFSPSGEKIQTVYIKFKRTLFSVAILFIIISAFSVPGYLLTNYIINTKTASIINNLLASLPFSKSADFTRRLADIFSPDISQKLFTKYPPGSPPGLMTRKVNKELNPAQLRDLGYLNGGNFSQKNGSVLAESTPSGSYLQINTDTQINGSLSVNIASVSGKLFADTVNTGFGDNEVYPMDQALLTSSSVSFSSISGGTISLSGASNQITLANTIISTQTNGSGSYTVSIPTLSAAGNFVIDNVSQTLTNKTISGSSNTFSNIPISALESSTITVSAGSGLSGGGSVSLGGSVSISNSGVTSITGTSNQVIASASTGGVTLSLPQDIATTSTPTFAGILLSGSTSGTLTLNAAAATTSYTLTLPADDGSNNYVLTTDGSGSTSWQAVGGGACANCILTDPSTSQTITPTSSTAIGLSIAQASGGSVDVFNVTNNAGSTKYFQVNSSGNISIAQTLTLGTGTVGLYTGSGAPSNGLGADGDYYFRNNGSNGNTSLYYKVSGAWIAAGGGSLQNAYDVGSTITTTSGNSVAITLADVATPTQFSVTQQDSAGTSAIYLNNANASGTNTNGILVEQTGAGAMTNGINITRTAGTLTNGLNFSGTFTNLINSPTFVVSNAGAISGVTGYSQASGSFSATGLSSGSISVTGASLALATVTSGDITATTAAGTGLFNVITGNLKVGNGSPTLTQDGEDAYIEGTFEVDGVSTFGGNVGIGTTATTKALTVNGVIRSGSSLAVDIDGNNGAGPLVRWTDTTVSDFMTMGSTGGTNNIDTLTRDFRIYSTAATSGIMFKQDSGNVGIGTTTPLALLHVGSGGTPGVASTGDVYIQNDLEVDGVINVGGAATFGSTTTLNGLTYTWPGSQSSGQVLSTNGSGTLSWTDPDSLTVRWNSIDNPNGNQSLSMSTYTSTWNWATGTSTNDLLNITSDASANGTGSLVNIQTGASSTLLPLRVRAGSTEALTVNANGNVGIGTTNATAKLSTTKTSTATSGISQDGVYFTYIANPGSITSSGTYFDGLVSSAQSTANGIDQTNTNLRGSTSVSTYSGNSTLGAAIGNVAAVYNTSSGTVNGGIGLQTALNNTGTGTIINARGILVGNITNSGGGTITSLNGVTINDQSGATNNTNLLIGTTTIPTGTVNYSIYNSSTYDNYFAGVLGINDTTPTEAKALVTRSTSTLTTATSEVGSYNIFTFSPASAPSSTSKFALDSVSAIGGSADTSAVTSYAGYFQVSNSNTDTTGTGANGVGVMGDVYNTSTGKAGALVALQGRVNNSSTGTITTAEGLQILASTNSGGGTVTTNYGILVGAQTVGTSDYGARIDAADTQTLWLSGNADNTTAAAGIAFGASRDTNLYRNLANSLYTDDSFTSGAASITSFSTTNEFAFLGGSDGNIELSDSSDNFTYIDFKNLAAEDYDGRIGYASASDNMNFYIAGSSSPTLQVSATTMTFTGTTLTASSLATVTTAATLGMTSTTTLNLGTSATINAAATALNIQADGTPDVNIAGGSSATGCTVANSSGNLTCTGNITGSGSGTVGFWSRSSTTLSPATANDIVSIPTTNTSGADLAITNTGVYTGTGIFNLTANSATTGDIFALNATALTSGSAMVLTGPSSVGVIDNFINITSDIGNGAAMLKLNPDFTSTPGTHYGLRIAATDTQSANNADYGAYSLLTLSGNGAKTAFSIRGDVSSSSTTADTLYSSYFRSDVNGAISTGTRAQYGVASVPSNTATNTGGATNIYSFYGTPSYAAGADVSGSTVNVYGTYVSTTSTLNTGGTSNQYGLYAANGTSSTNGTSTKYGLYVEAQSGADNNYGAYIASNTGIGDSDPTEGKLVVYSTHTSSTANYTAGVYNVTQASSAASSAQLIGVYSLYNTAHSSNTISTIRGTDLQTSFNSTMGAQATVGATNMYAIYTSNNVGGTAPVGTVTNAANLYVDSTYFSGASGAADVVFTNKYGINIANQGLDGTAGSGTFAITSAAGIALANTSSATNNTNLLIGTTTIPTGTVNYSIYNSSAYQNYIAGNVGIGGDTTPDAYLEVGDGTDELQVASTGDLTFVDANSGSSITGPAGGSLTLTAPATSLELQVDGSINVNIAGGSSATGCTVANATGNLTCSGNITGSGSGTVGFWSRSSTTLSPATANDIVSIANTTTSGADLAITNTGVYQGTGIFNLTANSADTGDIFNLSATGLTTGTAMTLTGPSSTGVTDHFVKVTADVGANAALVNLAPDWSGSAVTSYGLRVTPTDSTSTANVGYGVFSDLTLSGNAAKQPFGYYGRISSSSTTGDTLKTAFFTTSATGALASGARTVIGVQSNPASTAASTGGTLNMYGFYSNPTSTLSNPGASDTTANNVYGGYISTTATLAADCTTNCTTNQYGVYVDNGTSSTNGTSTKYGLYVAAQTGADSNYGAYFGSTVGIGNNSAGIGLQVGSSLTLTGRTDQYGIVSQSTYDSGATSSGYGVYSQVRTAASSFTMATAAGFYAADPNIGSGSTITTNHGVWVKTQTAGTNNSGITIEEATGTKNINLLIGTSTLPTGSYSIYNSSSDDNYFAGNLGIGDTSPTAKLEVGDGTDSLQVSSVGDLTFVDANSGSSITGPAGGSLTLTAPATSLELQVDGSINVNIAGGSSATGCTVANSTGNLTCSGNITGSGSGTVGFWSRSSTTLSPATANDIVSIANTTTTGSDLGITNTGVYTGNGVVNLIANSATTGNLLSLTSTGMTTGEVLNIDGTWAPTDGSTNEAIDINITHSNTTSADTFYGIDLAVTDGTALGNLVYSTRSNLTLSGNAAKTGIGVAGITTTSSTTGDSIIGTDGSATGTGNLSAAQSRNVWGARGVGTSTATSNASDATTSIMGVRAIGTTTTHTAGTTNVYGVYTLATGSHNADAGTITDYGVYIDNSAGNTNGTSTRYGLFVAAQTGADANYGAYFGSNVGIGTSTPAVKLQTNITSTNTNTSSTLAADIGLGVYNTDTTAGNISSIAFGNSFPAGQGQIGVVNVGSGALAGGHLYFGTRPASGGNILERMRIDTGGNVGVGTTAPAGKFDVTDASNTTSFSLTNNTATTLGAGANTAGVFDFQSTSLTTGNLANLEANALTTGTMLGVSSTSTALAGTATTGKGLLGNFDWTPGSATTASGDLFRLHIGPNGSTTGSLFNIVDDTSSIFAVSETAFTTSLPSNFTASGDVSVAYDIQFTNPTASYIKSVAPLTMVAGETFNSSNLTLQTYNSGSIVLDTSTSGTVLVPSANVGIGTSSPSTYLHIKGQNVSNRGQISLEATDYTLISFYSGATTGTNLEAYEYYDVTNSDLILQAYNNGAFGDIGLNISGGNVGIGTSAPARLLHVAGAARITTSTAVTDDRTLCTAAASGDIEFVNGACGTSSRRYKENIKELGYGLNELMQLNPVFFNYIKDSAAPSDSSLVDDRTKRRIGFIAEEMQQVIPEVVQWQNGIIEGIDYANLTALNTRAIQELNFKVENALLTLDPASGLANSTLNVNQITVGSEIHVGGLVSASNFALDSTNFNMTGALASVPVSTEGKVTVADAVNALDTKLGKIENKQASQSAELAQAKILGEQAVAQAQSLDGKVASTSANLASLSAQIQELLNSTSDSTDSSSLPSSPNDGLTPPAELLTASSSATLANLTVSDKLSAVNLSAMDATVSATLKSLGETFLGNTTIAGDISIDGTFSVSEGKSLNAFPTLYIQDSPLAMAVDIFNGKVKIGKTGNIEAEALALGDQSVGTATITAGQTEITIPSTLITATSRVFLTPMSAVSGNLYISQLTNGSGFKVKISQPNLSDVKFNWLIIGEKQ